MTRTLLHIDSSARIDGSTSRALSAEIVALLGADRVIRRDLAQGVPFVDAAWIEAGFTPADARSDAQRAALAVSDELLDEVMAADVIVIGAPIYNFSVPAVLKAWIDQIARAGRTFQYTEAGPRGLLEGKKAVLALASGGTPVGAPVDFASGYLRHIMGFIGITDVEIVSADQMMMDADASLARAREGIARLAA